MAAKKREIPLKAHPTGRSRPVIGLLLSRLLDDYQSNLAADLHTAAQELDVDLLCFVGGDLHPGNLPNVIYDLLAPQCVDGLILSPSLGHTCDAATLRAFYARFAALPMVGGASDVPELHQVMCDNYGGMRAAVEHLIVAHDYRRIAFIRGPAGHPEAEARYQAYVETLAAHQLPLEETLILAGDFDGVASHAAMAEWLRKGEIVDAIVASNDASAMAAIQLLTAHGLRTPEDVAIVGFDDAPAAQDLSVPLTTVRQPFPQMARLMLETVLQQIRGETPPLLQTVPAQLIVRRSCGCLPAAVRQAQLEMSAYVGKEILVMSRDTAPKEVPEALWYALVDELEGTLTGKFLMVFDQMLRQTYEERGDMEHWQEILSALRHAAMVYGVRQRAARPEFFGAALVMRLETLIQQARILASGAAIRLSRRLRQDDYEQVARSQAVDKAMNTVAELADLPAVLAECLPPLRIDTCYVALYAGDASARTAQARLALSYHQGASEYHTDAAPYPAVEIAPPPLWPPAARTTLMVVPLLMRERPLGFALLTYDFHPTWIHDQLSSQLSGAVFRSLLIAQQQQAQRDAERLLADVQRRARLLSGAAEIARAATSLTQLSELLPRAAELICEHFELYYVGIFLVDEALQWAVLSADAGAAGHRLLEQGYKLPIGLSSLVGTAVIKRHAQVVTDVIAEASNYLAHPLLPDTRSEIVLPLISREQVVGAMSIQSVEPNIFSTDDLLTLQTMADQLANAIANVRLLEQMTQSRYELEMASGRYTLESWREYVSHTVQQLGYRYRQVAVEPTAEKYPEAQQALERRAPVLLPLTETPGARSALAAPIRLRNQILGVLDLRFEEDDVPPETVEWVNQIADRLAISLESARLLQETRSTAEREHLVGRVTAQMRENLDVDAVLRTAVSQIREVMDLSRVTVRLATRPRKSDEG